jgi:tripartite ATP-independent transporter DctP family solute receptor
MKKCISIIAGLLLCLSLAACGSGSTEDEAKDIDQEETYTIKMATDEVDDSPGSQATFIFEKLVEEAGDGRLQVEFYTNAAMGDEREIAESVAMGNLEGAIISAGFWSSYDDNWYVTDLPYVWLDRETMYGYLDNEVGQLLRDSLMESTGVQILDYFDGSFKCITNAKKPLYTASDLQGLKIRCQDTQMNLSIYNSWNGSAVPMGYSEIYTALQQGTIDGVDTSPIHQIYGKFNEVTKYYTLTNHQAMIMVSVINADFMNGLPEDLQQIILDSSREAYAVQEREIVVRQEADSFEAMKETGMQYCELTDEQKNTFVEASKPVIEEYRGTISNEIYSLLGL